MLGPKSDNSIEDGDGNTQVGHNSGTIVQGIDPSVFIAAMREKEAKIDALIADKDTLKDKVSSLEKAQLEAQVRELSEQKEVLETRLANPELAISEHNARASQIETLLEDLAAQQSLGENCIRSALEAFNELDYAEIDALLDEVERQGELTIAKAAYARGVVAEDAIKWHDAAKHYAKAARLAPDFDSLHKASEYAEKVGDYTLAERYSADLVAWTKTNGTQEQQAAALNEHAINSGRLGRYPKAEDLYRQALEIDRVTIGEAHPDYATRLNNLASVVTAQDRTSEAEALCHQALEIDRATIGEAHPSYATHLNNLAGVVQAQGRFSDAEALYRQALVIDGATIGEAHPNYAIHLNNLAFVVQAQGCFSEAEALYRQALVIDGATIGEAHPNYAIRLNNLALVVKAQDRYSEAEALYRQALEIGRATISEAHPNYAIHLGNLGMLSAKTGQVEEAREMLTQALAILRDTLPPEHPHIAEAERRLDALPAP